ncbi:cyclin-dependent kinase 2-associated protein 1 isoform X1 [Suricata suricatta]|uniref:cyclin-dependent kinase 2-associated protein 1 isoform X1 n=1 Tax=Suricata suricatta TaxID=37032 RepID=UPI00115650A0|nr:cyclin-dependent kinase 2-associated protein 1 isoform X1 [Suricata suricatta]
MPHQAVLSQGQKRSATTGRNVGGVWWAPRSWARTGGRPWRPGSRGSSGGGRILLTRGVAPASSTYLDRRPPRTFWHVHLGPRKFLVLAFLAEKTSPPFPLFEMIQAPWRPQSAGGQQRGPGTGNSQVPQSKYAELLAIIEELGKEIRPTYAGSKSAMERLKRGIIHARGLVRECLAETERNARS